MKNKCELSKRPSLAFVAGTAFFIVTSWMATLFLLQFFMESLWLSGALTYLFALVLLVLPTMLWFSDFRILIESSNSTFRASRQLFVFKWKIASKTFEDIADVFWKKHDHVDSTGTTYHLWGRQRSKDCQDEFGFDVILSGGFCHAIALTYPDVDTMRTAFCQLRNAG